VLKNGEDMMPLLKVELAPIKTKSLIAENGRGKHMKLNKRTLERNQMKKKAGNKHIAMMWAWHQINTLGFTNAMKLRDKKGKQRLIQMTKGTRMDA
jgi:hypothetical protein